jgi:hypothetical protein
MNKLTDGTGSMVLPTARWFSRNQDLPDVAVVIADLRALVAGTAVQWVDGDAREGVRGDTSEVRVAGKTLTRFRNPDRGGAIELWCEAGHTMGPHVTPVVGYMCDSKFKASSAAVAYAIWFHFDERSSVMIGCGVQQPDQTEMVGCRQQCDYDLCMRCFEGSTRGWQ